MNLRNYAILNKVYLTHVINVFVKFRKPLENKTLWLKSENSFCLLRKKLSVCHKLRALISRYEFFQSLLSLKGSSKCTNHVNVHKL